ncbi:MAG: hypothetical protein K2O64_06855, partial [Lactobacillus sp.]|nr:hypothetical protein [Lactobacillus sp.]
IYTFKPARVLRNQGSTAFIPDSNPETVSGSAITVVNSDSKPGKVKFVLGENKLTYEYSFTKGESARWTKVKENKEIAATGKIYVRLAGEKEPRKTDDPEAEAKFPSNSVELIIPQNNGEQ